MLAFFYSRAASRWIAALLVTAFLAAWVYLYPSLGDISIVNLPTFSLSGDGSPPPEAESPPAQNSADFNRRPPWIDVPAPFDVSHVPGYNKTTAKINTPSAIHPRLLEAMTRFIERPVLSSEQAAAQNEAACPREQLDKQVNADQLRGDREKWLAVDQAMIMEMRYAALNFLEVRSKDEGEAALMGPGLRPEGKAVEKGSRGVVIAAGNHRTVERAVTAIKEMRKLGWKGGIELWHFSGELQDESDRKSLKDLTVEIHMVSTEKKPGQWKNFELKAEAILRSSFDEVLYIDSDNFPLSDITALFNAPLFTDPRGGQAVFWPDLNRDHPDNAIHRVLGIPCHDAWELDSGQILIAKSGNNGLNLAALYLAKYMQTEGDYWFSGGDKDTFRYAFLALGIPYTPAPRWLAVLGNYFTNDGGEEFFCGAAMLQYGLGPPRHKYTDPSDALHPEPLFVHANLFKHMSGMRKGEVFPKMRRLSPAQDDVRVLHKDGQAWPLDHIVGGARIIEGRGLCSDIWSFGDGATVETVETKDAFRGLMGGFEEKYFEYGLRPGAWKRKYM